MKVFKKIWRALGPGLVTGAADDDPSGIATYSQAGAKFGYGQLWMAIFMLPLQIAIQEACARVGIVTGHGIAAITKKHYSRALVFVVVLLILIANIINIGADIAAMAAAAELIVPFHPLMLTLFFTLIILLLEVFVCYKTYASLLKWLCLSLLAYIITVFIVNPPWMKILLATFIPHIEFTHVFLFMMIAMLGTTISPYLFFWEASQEVEEHKTKHLKKCKSTFHVSKQMLTTVRIDNFIGMFFSEITAWSIIVVAGTVLHNNGMTEINSAADAAKALEPFVQNFPNAGYLAKLIFAIGIIGLGLLSIPILAGSAAYAMSEVFNWRASLDLKFRQAYGFYSVIILATVTGLLINLISINPIAALVYAAVINGIVAVPLIFLIALIARNKKIMGKHRSGILSHFFVWLTFLCMATTVIIIFFI